MRVEDVLTAAKRAKAQGATRFCMGAAWRQAPKNQEFDQVLEMVKGVNNLGLESCCTLGMISEDQALALKEAGLYAYNHNLDTAKSFYGDIISTRKYEQRIETIKNVRGAGITVCTGGILGMGETEEQRIEFISELASLDPAPESVTINSLVRIPGTPLENEEPIEALEVIRVIATVRNVMPKSMIRLSAGRKSLSSTEQLLAYYCGANSIFLGDKLLTSENPKPSQDRQLFADLSLRSKSTEPPAASMESI